jgi:hypothetical protein
MLERESTYYEANKEYLHENYLGRYIVISDNKVIGTYNSDGEAYTETVKTLPLGSFMIKYMTKDPADLILELSPVLHVG